MKKIFFVLPVMIPFSMLMLLTLMYMYLYTRLFKFPKNNDIICNLLLKYLINKDIDLATIDLESLKTPIRKKVVFIRNILLALLFVTYILECIAIIIFKIERI